MKTWTKYLLYTILGILISVIGGSVGHRASYPESSKIYVKNRYGENLPHICVKSVYKVAPELCK